MNVETGKSLPFLDSFVLFTEMHSLQLLFLNIFSKPFCGTNPIGFAGISRSVGLRGLALQHGVVFPENNVLKFRNDNDALLVNIHICAFLSEMMAVAHLVLLISVRFKSNASMQCALAFYFIT